MPRSDDSTTPKAGIYRKFTVMRTDGSSEQGGKHEYCSYFVLDWEHDPFAVPAALAYASACEATYPELAKDLRDHARAHASAAPAQEVAPPVPRRTTDPPRVCSGTWWSTESPLAQWKNCAQECGHVGACGPKAAAPPTDAPALPTKETP